MTPTPQDQNVQQELQKLRHSLQTWTKAVKLLAQRLNIDGPFTRTNWDLVTDGDLPQRAQDIRSLEGGITQCRKLKTRIQELTPRPNTRDAISNEIKL
jgi:hypothetical protein